jgi:pyrroloquinoline quinone (PQQ) biosynthesis protein C
MMAKKEKPITLTYKHRRHEVLVEMNEKDLSASTLLKMFEKMAYALGMSHKEVQQELLKRASEICI